MGLLAWRSWFQRAENSTADTCYIALLAQARNPFFFDRMGVPDTLDGRFELIVLHLWLMQSRLREANNADAEAFSQGLVEAFFNDMERSLRELGVADTGLKYRIKAMATAYHGRLQAYSAAQAERDAFCSALARNLYGTVADGDPAHLTAMAEYCARARTALATLPIISLENGPYPWPSPA